MGTKLKLTNTIIDNSFKLSMESITPIHHNPDYEIMVKNITLLAPDMTKITLNIYIEDTSYTYIKVDTIKVSFLGSAISIMDRLAKSLKDPFENYYFNIPKDTRLAVELVVVSPEGNFVNLNITGELYD